MKQKKVKSRQKLVRRFSHFSRRASEDSIEHIQENLIERIPHARRVRLLILEWVLLVAAIIFLAITQAFWYSDSYATITYTTGGSYTEATLGKVNSLNPLFATTSSEKTLAKLMFATLSAPDYSGHTGLDLAASIRADDSGKVWSIKLRDNLKWSDGEPITNEDVLYTIGIIQDANVNTAYTSNLAGVKVSTDGDRIIFTLPAAYVNFPSALNIPILPAHILADVDPELLFEHSFSTNPVTSGAFSYNATQSIGTDGEMLVYLTPNTSYFKGAPMLASFAVHAYLTEEDIIAALNSGAVTATAELLPSHASHITSPNVYQKQTALASGAYAFINLNSPVLNNQALRRAIQQGVDIDALRSNLNGETRLDYPILSSQIDIGNYPALPEHNPEAAKATIAAAGISEDVSIRVVTVSTGRLPTIAEKFTEQLKGLGLNATATIYDPSQDFLMGVIRPRSYDILIYEVDLGPDPDIFAYYHSSQASNTGLNLSNYRSALSDELILGARSTMDISARITRYESFLKNWVEEVPAIGIYQTNLAYYLNKNVRSFSEDNRLVYPIDRFADVARWASEHTTKNRTP